MVVQVWRPDVQFPYPVSSLDETQVFTFTKRRKGSVLELCILQHNLDIYSFTDHSGQLHKEGKNKGLPGPRGSQTQQSLLQSGS